MKELQTHPPTTNLSHGRVRLAITGQKVSPPLFESIQAMGRELVRQRPVKALQILD